MSLNVTPRCLAVSLTSAKEIVAVANVRTGETKMVLKDARIGDLVFNPKTKSLWGLRHLNGFFDQPVHAIAFFVYDRQQLMLVFLGQLAAG